MEEDDDREREREERDSWSRREGRVLVVVVGVDRRLSGDREKVEAVIQMQQRDQQRQSMRGAGGGGASSQSLAQLKLGVLQCVSRMEDRDTAQGAVRELQALLRGGGLGGKNSAGARHHASRSLADLGIEGLTVVLNALISGYRGSSRPGVRRECVNALAYMSREDTNCPLSSIIHLLLGKASSFVCKCFKDTESSVRLAAVNAAAVLAANAAVHGGGPHAGSVVVRAIIETLLSDGCQNREVQAASCNALAAVAPHSEDFSDISIGSSSGSGSGGGARRQGGGGDPYGGGIVIERLLRLFVSPTFHAHASLLHLFGNCDSNSNNSDHGCSGIVVREGGRRELRLLLPALTSMAESVLQNNPESGGSHQQIDNLDWHARVGAAAYLRCVMTHFGPEIFATTAGTDQPMTTFERLSAALHAAKTDRLKPIRAEVNECLTTLSIIMDITENGAVDMNARQWRMRFNINRVDAEHDDTDDSGPYADNDPRNVAGRQQPRRSAKIGNRAQNKYARPTSASVSATVAAAAAAADKRVSEAFLRRAVDKDTVVGGTRSDDDDMSESSHRTGDNTKDLGMRKNKDDAGDEWVDVDGRMVPTMRENLRVADDAEIDSSMVGGEERGLNGGTFALGDDAGHSGDADGGNGIYDDNEEDEYDETASEALTDSVINELNNKLRLHSSSGTEAHHHHHHHVPSTTHTTRPSLQRQRGFEEQVRYLQEQQDQLISMVTEMREAFEQNFMEMSNRVMAISSIVRSIQRDDARGRAHVLAESPSHGSDIAMYARRGASRHRSRSRHHDVVYDGEYDDLDDDDDDDVTLTTDDNADEEGGIGSADDVPRRHRDRKDELEHEIRKLRRQRKRWEEERASQLRRSLGGVSNSGNN